MADQLSIALVTASGTTLDSEDEPSDDTIEEFLDELFGRRAGSFVGIVHGEGDEILFVTYMGKRRYELNLQKRDGSEFENTDAALELDEILEIALGFAARNGSWWRDFHWKKTRSSSKRSSSKRAKKKSGAASHAPSQKWIYNERRKLGKGLRYQIFKRDGFRCQICGANAQTSAVQLEVDHIVPVSRGGRTVEDNLRTTCQACNRGKSNLHD